MKHLLTLKLAREKTLYERLQNLPEAFGKTEQPRMETGGFCNYRLLRRQNFPNGFP